MPPSNTRAQILKIACEILASDGLGTVSFDAIARRLGKSKQAVLYWFPTKQDLLAAMFLPWLEAEADAAAAAIAQSADRDAAIRDFVRGVAAFHLADLNRFRSMYLLPQTIKTGSVALKDTGPVQQVHRATDKIYETLAAHLDGDPASARAEALAIHAAVLGLVLMCGLADTLQDPLKHSQNALIDALVGRLCGDGAPPAQR